MMKKIFIAAAFLIFCSQSVISFAQTTFFHRYTIFFTDKNNNPFSISQPEEFLSPRAIERRSKQNIQYEENDLPVTPSYIDSIKSTGVLVLYSSKWLNCVTIFTLDSLALQHINTFPFVQSVNVTGRNSEHTVSNSVTNNFSSSMKMECADESYYGLGKEQITQVHGEALHNEGFKGEGMLIAMLDAGYTNTQYLSAFDSLRNRNGIIATRNFVAPWNNVYSSASHGSSTLSTIAANLPGYFVGTAPHANFVLVISEDAAGENPVEEINWAAAAEYADSIGADIISSSLGYSTFDTAIFNHFYSDMDGISTQSSIAAKIASQKGMIVCNSAGNSGADTTWHYMTAPSDAEDILCVGAVDSNSVYAPFSGHGPTFDGRVKPDIMSRGALAYVVNTTTGVFNMSNGTSFSCPIVAGLTACLWQAHPEKTNLEIMNAIRISGSTHNSPNDSMGFGIANFAYADLLLSGFDNESMKNNLWKIYPTLFSDEINVNITFPRNEIVKFDWFDISGRWINSQCNNVYAGFNHLILSTENLSAGVYFLRININDTVSYEKLVKI